MNHPFHNTAKNIGAWSGMVLLFTLLISPTSWSQDSQILSAEEPELFTEEVINEDAKSDETKEQALGDDVQFYLNQQAPSAIFSPKKPTPSRFFAADTSMPESFTTTNNLLKKVGSFYHAFGEPIIVQGTVTDSFGVPIEGAVVEVWQTNASGKYHSLLEPDSEFIDPYFNMSGKAITDNLGNYHFVTIMPGTNPGRAPHINMNIYHSQFGRIETEMYFAQHQYNDSDFQYLAYEEEERKMLTADVKRSDLMDASSIKICRFDIVMTGTHKFKGF